MHLDDDVDMLDPDSDDYWKTFIGQIDNRYWIVVGPCVDIFSEAVLAYKAKAYLAACIMCRASVEAILHLAKTITKFGDSAIDRRLYGSEKKDYPSFTKLIIWAKGEHLLDELESKVDSIQNDGDFGAHLVQKMDQSYFSLPRDMGTSIRIWISPEISRQRILDTAEVILQVTKRKWPLE